MDQITKLLTLINIQQLQQSAYLIYNNEYFQYTIITISLIVPFILGRLFHERTFSNLLSMINDAQTTSNKLTNQKTQIQIQIQKTKDKKYILVGFLIIVIATLIVYTHFVLKTIDYNLLIGTAIAIAIILLLSILRINYLKWKKSSIQIKLAQTNLTKQSQLKVILTQIGPEIQKNLKNRFQRQIQGETRKQQLRECNLSKCYNQRRSYDKLYILYKQIISQLTKFTWCPICSSQQNLNTMQLKLPQLDGNIQLYKKLSKDPKFPIQKQKEMINKMLEEWKNLKPNLVLICKRGCCVRFRELLDGLKKEHYKQMNDLKAGLKM